MPRHGNRAWVVPLACVASASLVASCGSRTSLDLDPPEPQAIAAFDATIADATNEPSTSDAPDAKEAPMDAGFDVARADASPDGHEALPDATQDVAADTAPEDANDAALDVAPDAPSDAAGDAGVDAARDASCALTYGSPVTYPIGPWARTLAVGDLTGDGLPEIVFNDLLRYGGASISVLAGLGARAFSSETSYPAHPTETKAVVVADMNGDGKLDVIASERLSSTVGVYINAGSGVLGARVDYPTGAAIDAGAYFAGDIAAADLNGDGRPDIVVAEQTLAGQGGGAVGVLLNDGSGGLLPEQSYPNSAVAGPMGGTYTRGPNEIAVADFNADGAIDIAVTTVDENVAVYLNHADGTFAPEVQYSLGKQGPTGANTKVAVGDFDGDGRPDLLVTDAWGPASLGVFPNLGSGAFGTEATIVSGQSLGSEYEFIAVADVDRDGKSDIVTASVYGDQPGVSVFLNAGGATFAAPMIYPADAMDYVEGLVVADLDRDGVMDVVLVTDGSVTEVLYGSCP